MSLQDIFYLTATIAMVLTILFLLGMVGLLFYIKMKITELNNYGKHVIGKADNMVERVKEKVHALTRFQATILGKTQK